MNYRKKPVTIQALQWTGANLFEIEDFAQNSIRVEGGVLMIDTLEGTMKASVGDFIIRGVCGEYYACKPDIFEQTYEKVE